MGVVPVDLVGRTLPQRGEELVDGAGIRQRRLRRRLRVFGVDDHALQGEGAFAGEEADHFAELEGVALRGGVVAEFALALLGGVEGEEMAL